MESLRNISIPARMIDPLHEDETKTFFAKLSKYIGSNMKQLIERPDGLYCFRLHRDRVFYVREDIMKRATNIAQKNLVGLGTCFGKFTRTEKFRMGITALEYVAPLAKAKIWLKASGEQSFLYGNHVLKSQLGRMTDGAERNQGVVVMSMTDVPLGFGALAVSTIDVRQLQPIGIVAFHQGDLGEYIRDEDAMIN